LRVYKNRVLRRIFGPEREEVAGGWRRLHSGELHNSIRAIKSRRMRWEDLVARTRDDKCMQNYDRKARREETTLKI
jgi:hypothetical protein